MKRITIDPYADKRWVALIEAQPSSIFHSPAWIRVLANTYNFDIKANVLVDSDEDSLTSTPCSGLLFCNLADIRGNRIVSLPFCDFTDPLVETIEQWNQLVDPLLDRQLPFKIRPLHNPIPLEDTRFEKTNQARWHGLALSPSLDELWMGLNGSVRTSVRKAEKHNVIIRTANEESDLEAFFRLHVSVRKNKYRMVAQPYRFFQNVWQELIAAGRGKLFLAVYNGKVIAATIFLCWKETLYYKFNASNPEMLWLNPNELLLWVGIKYGKELGCQLIDFGLSDWDQDGLIYYKRKFSSMEKTIYFLQYTSDALSKDDYENQKNLAAIGALLPKLTDLFTDESVPEQITQKAGELLYRYFA